jgi:hypothetical protein
MQQHTYIRKHINACTNSQTYPFVVGQVLRNETQSLATVLRAILFSSDGTLQHTRLSTLLNATLGYVADAQGGFIDLDAVPDDGASMAYIAGFRLSEVGTPSLLICLYHRQYHSR